MKFRKDIEGLRAIAVVPVVLFHAGLSFPGGFVGVDIFFIISGFLITKILISDIDSNSFSIVNFYERRIRRIFPALLATIFSVVVATTAIMLPEDAEDIGETAAAAALFGSNIYYWMNVPYFDEGAFLKPLLNTWSLAVEEQFYLVWPIFVYLVYKISSDRLRLALVMLAAVASFVLCLWATPVHPKAAFYSPMTRGWELAIGAVIAMTNPRPGRKSALTLGLVGLGAIFYALFAFSEAMAFPGWRAAIPCLGAAALLIAGSARGEERPPFPTRILELPPLTFLGRISYSLYLWHWPILVFAGYGMPDPMPPGAAAACVMLSVLIAWLSWRWIETPFRIGKVAKTRASVFAWGAGATAATLLIAFGLVRSDAAAWKLSPRQHHLLDRTALRDGLKEQCHDANAKHASWREPCIRGASAAAPSFVLLGDSHAGALAPGPVQRRRGARHRWLADHRPGFLPLPGRRTPRGEDPRNAAVFSFLEDRRDVEVVIVAAYWLMNATGNTYRHRHLVFMDEDYDGSGSAYNARALEAGLLRLADRFPHLRFVLLDDVPSGLPLHLRQHVRQELLPWLPSPTGALSREVADAQRAAYEPILRRVARERANVVYFDVQKDLCGPDICPLFLPQGEPAYRDGDHLSAKGALALERPLRNILARNISMAAIGTDMK